jgi:hypothetical protein
MGQNPADLAQNEKHVSLLVRPQENQAAQISIGKNISLKDQIVSRKEFSERFRSIHQTTAITRITIKTNAMISGVPRSNNRNHSIQCALKEFDMEYLS